MKGVGRVFFWPQVGERLEEIAFQPLENHRENVKTLLKSWTKKGEFAADEATHPRLLQAVDHHDGAKPETFRLIPPRKGGGWSYSFAGHRFRLPEELKDPYARAIERGHHDYSTPEVVRAAFRLMARPQDLEGLDPDTVRRRFATDLYIYEMCDQIEADLSGRIWAGEARETPFLTFEVIPKNPKRQNPPFPYGTGPLEFALEPFPFAGPLALTFRFQVHDLRGWQWEGNMDELARRLEGLALSEGREVAVKAHLVPLAEEDDA